MDKCGAMLRGKGVQCLSLIFPEEMKEESEDEQFRRYLHINPEMAERLWKVPFVKSQMEKVSGREITFEERCRRRKAIEACKKPIGMMDAYVSKKVYGENKNTVYVIGACTIEGVMVFDETEEFGYCLWEALQQNKAPYKVECIIIPGSAFQFYEEICQQLTLTENDIVIWMNERKPENILSYEVDIPIEKIMKRRDCDWYYDCPIHTNHIGNKEITKSLVEEYLAPIIQKEKKNPEYLQIGKKQLQKDEEALISDYISSINMEAPAGSYIGSIVMNCNPMTKGHYHLIDTVRKKVDYLYVFLVEEDKSEYTFRERFSLVQQETANMKNVKVVSSGRYILSYQTMPLYFEKSEKQQAVLDATDDLYIFCQYIAPALGIKERFVGEEPTDMITKQYNESMKHILPFYNIAVTEIPRLETNGDIISASKVRKYVNEKDWDNVKKYVTDGVYEYLYNRHIQKEKMNQS